MPIESDPTVKARHRAFDLADTGRFWGWHSISAAIVAEGSNELTVRRLDRDSYFKFRLGQRIKAALKKRYA